MSTLATAAFYDQDPSRKGQLWLMYPVFIWAGFVALFFLFGGGKGLGRVDGDRPHLMGFNTNVPTAEDTQLKKQSINHPAYGSQAEGQKLSNFTNTQKLSATNQLQEFPGEEATSQAAANNVSNSTANVPNLAASTPAYGASPSVTKADRSRKGAGRSSYQYMPAQPYYVNSPQTDQQLEQQLSTYQSSKNKQTGQPAPETDQTLGASSQTLGATGSHPHNFIQLDDQTTASRLNEGTPSPVVENPFNTAPVGPNRQQGVVTSLQSSGYNKRSVITMIPAVIHDDQSVKAGQPVKLRLTKAVVIDGIRVPANTIIHATCLPDGDRLRLVVQNLQLGSQLIPLDLEAVDMDGGTGLNAPGLSDQIGGQLKSSAVQGVNIPTRSMLVNTVLNAARFGASSSVRQSQIHLKGGYQLHLKAI